MEFILLLAVVVILLVLAHFHSQLAPLRSAIESLEDKIDDHIRSLERRLAQLEKSNAVGAMGLTEVSAVNLAVVLVSRCFLKYL